MKTALAILVAMHLATYGIDLAYYATVPGYGNGNTDSGVVLGQVNFITLIAVVVLAAACIVQEFRDGNDR